jgi:hypothetical protein
MTLRVPEAHLAVWVVFKIALEESGETPLAGGAALVTITIGIAHLAVATQRPNVASSDLPQALAVGTRRFEAVVAQNLNVLLDRAEAFASRDLPDLRASLAEVTGAMQAAIPRIADPQIAAHVESRLALYRELVPRLERLGTGGFRG